MNPERWAAIKALRPTPVMFPVERGERHRRLTPKKRRPAGIVKHLAAQRTSSPAREAKLAAVLVARDRRRVPVTRTERRPH